MELEVKHLAPYLPYGLKLQYVVREKVEQTGIMKSISHNEDETHPTRVLISAMYNEEHIWMFKPLLKSISKLDELLWDEFSKHREGMKHDEKLIDLFSFENIHTEEMLNDIKLSNLPYDCIEYIFGNHYDYFGLIDAGLATELS